MKQAVERQIKANIETVIFYKIEFYKIIEKLNERFIKTLLFIFVNKAVHPNLLNNRNSFFEAKGDLKLPKQ